MKLDAKASTFEDWIAPYYTLKPQPQRGEARFKSFKQLCETLKPKGLALPAVHITGSNGKGSVGLMVARALQHSSYRVGRFSSPHLLHFNERIEVGSQPISEERVCELGESIYKQAADLGYPISFFEWSFLIALEHFALENVEIMVIEAGIGGRLDTTNVIQNTLASALVSISIDHADILGPTIEHITRDKLGILRKRRPAIFGPSVPLLADEEANRLKAPIYRIGPKESYFEENRDVARALLAAISTQYELLPNAIEEGLRAKLKGRFHIFEPNLILDVAHNIGGITNFLGTLSRIEWGRAPIFLGLRKDKAIAECLKEAKRYSEEIFFVFFDHPLCPSKKEVIEEFKKAHVPLSGLFLSAEKALAFAGNLHKKCVFLGSFFFIGAALTFLNQTGHGGKVPGHLDVKY